jgi:hypothetical protein
MGTSVAPGAAAVECVAVTAGAEVAAGLVVVGWAVATRALADGVAPPAAADDVPGVQAGSASPAPRPSATMPAILVGLVKYRECMIFSFGS